MSRIGKKPVAVPKGVTASVNGQEVSVKGPKGELKHVLVDDVIAKLEDGSIEVSPREDTQNARAMWGMSRTLISNLMTGVTEGFTKKLEITGVGYAPRCRGRTSSSSSATATTWPFPFRKASRWRARSRPRS